MEPTQENKPNQEQEHKPEQEKQSEEYKVLGTYEAKIESVIVQKKHIAPTSYGQRVRLAKIHDNYEEFLYQTIKVGGWVKSVRQGGKDVMFIVLNDGSSQKDLQVVVDKVMPGFDELTKANVGFSFQVVGTLIKSIAKGQPYELVLRDPSIHSHHLLGVADPAKYPLSKKKHSLEYLREIAHLRPRTNTFGAVARVRNNLALATHLFFQEKGFLYVHTPIITASDCEGAGQMFQVTTVLPEHHEPIEKVPTVGGADDKEEKKEEAKSKKQQKKEKNKEKKQGKPQDKGGEPSKEAGELKEVEKVEAAAKEEVQQDKAVEEIKEPVPVVPFDQRPINYKKDMFGKPSFLTVSGQLNVENYCCSLSDCYTFGPTFRAENSHTSRHLSEFWMIEPELAFATLEDNMECAESYLKFCLSYVLKNNEDDIKFFEAQYEKGLIERLKKVIETPFRRVPYTEAVEILEKDIKEKKTPKFENKVYWGVDLASEHEKYLTEKVFEGPIILYNYPKDIKAFYMKMNEDGKTVQAMDVLVPRIGEIIGGSAREENLEKLDKRIIECKLEMAGYWWYRELREYGTVPHTGFGLGFERLVMMATGMENIRDVIPFPRFPGNAEF